MQKLKTEFQCKPYGYIYLTTNLVNGMRQIGQHSSPVFDKQYYGSGKLIKQALKKYGTENFKCEVIEQCYSFEELNQKEIFWIDFYHADSDINFYNIAYGGSNSKYCLRGENHPWYNKKHSAESIKKMSESKCGENNPMYGKHHTEETKRKIGNAQIGEKNHMFGKHQDAYWFNKSRSEETKNKISNSRIKNKIASEENNHFYGKHHTQEARSKISEAQSGRIYVNNGIHNKRIKPDELEDYLSCGYAKGRLIKKKVDDELS